MEVTVCGLYTTSAPVEMPQPILNLQRLTFPGSPIDKVGKQCEAGANGMTKGANIASWLANFPSCVVM